MLVAKRHHQRAHPIPSAMSFMSSFASNRCPSHVCMPRRYVPVCAAAPRAVSFPSCIHYDCHIGQSFLSLKSLGHCRPVLANFRLGNLASPVSSANSGDTDTDTDQEDAPNRLSPLQLIAANPRGSANAAAVNRLKKAELQEELNLRGLPEEGPRDVLRQRLNQAIKSEQSVSAGELQP